MLNAYTAAINFSGQLDAIILNGGNGEYSGTQAGTKFSGFIVLNTDDAALINKIAGVSMFNAGDLVDLVNLEGDTLTSGGGRIEIGLSYIFDSNTFSNSSLGNYPFDPNDVLLALFFIVEEDAIGGDIYSSAGQLDEMPFSASLWPLEAGTVYEYSNSDNSGADWNSLSEVLEEASVGFGKYYHIREWNYEQGERINFYIRTTETEVYLWTGVGEELVFQIAPIGTKWSYSNLDGGITVTEIITIDQVIVP